MSRNGKTQFPGILEEIMDWPDGRDFGELPEKDITALVENMTLKVCHADAHMHKSRTTEEHQSNVQMDNAAKAGKTQVDLDLEQKDFNTLTEAHIREVLKEIRVITSSLPTSSRPVYSPEQEIKQRGQENCIGEQGASTKSQMEEKNYGIWKKRQATRDFYGNIIRECGEGWGPLGIQYDKGFQGQQEGLPEYIDSKRQTRENMGPMQNQMDILVPKDTEKAELLNAFFASVLTAETGPQESQTLELRVEGWRKGDLLLIVEGWV
ncbi:hypothetical protein WISP_94194 [Willisornis vidua]|uniref:Uncharacterized protein n=1 Tax=Willisornis vidua TaxID=1566151 RepID=A0ABQ9D5S6_9PASS|nr:hypothetical protein WISP_94194 [Willisornis vidua]